MTKENLFKLALKNRETNDFFRGSGIYFARDRDWGVHMPAARMSGAVGLFLKEDAYNAILFKNAFKEFIKTLDPTLEDLNHLLGNLSAYFSLKNDGNLCESNLFEQPSSEEEVLLRTYLSSVKHQPFYNEQKDKIVRHASFIRRNGENNISDLLTE